MTDLCRYHRETRSLLLGIVRWDSCLDTDEEHLNFARRDELNRTHIEEGEETDGPLNFELDVCHQDPEHKSPAPLPCAQVKLITSWEAGWNVTNAIQETRLYEDWKDLWQRQFSCSMIRITQ
nr:vesicular inhibitory amino acid transporter [Columba livia]